MFIARLDEARSRLVEFLFPPQCIGCGREGAFICAPCRYTLPWLTSPVCPICGKPVVQWEERCLYCRTSGSAIDGVRSPFAFQGIIRKAIHQLKYGHFRVLAAPLGQLLAQYLKDNPMPVDVLVPVPLHHRRLRERGYNQSALLAAEVGKECGLPVIEDFLIRVRHTRSQAEIADAVERERNVREAFDCRGGGLLGKRVVVIDDVCTTGATLNSCAIALKKAGAISVWGLALAREV